MQEESGDIPHWALSDNLGDDLVDEVRLRKFKCTTIELSIYATKLIQPKGLARSYTVFLIEIQLGHQGWVVDRSFDDFLYLHQQICKYVVDASKSMIPPLPSRRISERLFGGSSKKAAVNEARRISLQSYLQSLVQLPSAWDGNELVKFLDNPTFSLMFTWNVDRMRKVQNVSPYPTLSEKFYSKTLFILSFLDKMLDTMMISGCSPVVASMKSEYHDAHTQLVSLKEKLLRMEMLFLQQAAGVSSKELSRDTISAISTTDEPVRLSYDSQCSDEQTDNRHTSSLSLSSAVGILPGSRNSSSISQGSSRGVSHDSIFHERPDAPTATDTVGVNDLISDHVASGAKLSAEEVQLTVDFAYGRVPAAAPALPPTLNTTTLRSVSKSLQDAPGSAANSSAHRIAASLLTSSTVSSTSGVKGTRGIAAGQLESMTHRISWPLRAEDVRAYAIALKIQEVLRLSRAIDMDESTGTGSRLPPQARVDNALNGVQTSSIESMTESSVDVDLHPSDPESNIDETIITTTTTSSSSSSSTSSSSSSSSSSSGLSNAAPPSVSVMAPTEGLILLLGSTSSNGIPPVCTWASPAGQEFSDRMLSYRVALLAQVDRVISASVTPTVNSLQDRHRIFRYLRDSVACTLGAQLLPMGSFVSSTFLPGADLDATVFLVKPEDEYWYVKTNEALCLASFGASAASVAAAGSKQKSDPKNHKAAAASSSPVAAAAAAGSSNEYVQGSTQESSRSTTGTEAAAAGAAAAAAGAAGAGVPGAVAAGAAGAAHFTSPKFSITNVSFISTDVKVVNSTINNISVNISANQISGLYGQALLAAVDDHIGKNHLFKRSLLLVKAWCQYESPRYTGGMGPIMGSKEGRISSWGVVVMLIWIFNMEGQSIEHPLQALGHFLLFYSSFDWNKFAITVHGPVSAVDLRGLEVAELAAFKPGSFFPRELLVRYSIRYEEAHRSSVNAFDIAGSSSASVGGTGGAVDMGAATPAGGGGRGGGQRRQGSSARKGGTGPIRPPSNWGAAIAFSKGDYYRRGLMNVMDPIVTKHSVCRPVDLPGQRCILRALSNGRRALEEMCVCLMSSLESANQDGVSERQAQSQTAADAFVSNLLSNTVEWTSARREKDFSSVTRWPAIPATSTATAAATDYSPIPDVLATQSDEIEASLFHAELLLSSIIRQKSLLHVTAQILNQKGPMSIGEVGKYIQRRCHTDAVMRRIKEQFGGLKRAIEVARSPMFEVLPNHQFNPTIKLVGDIRDVLETEQKHERMQPVNMSSVGQFDHSTYLLPPIDSTQSTQSESGAAKSIRRTASSNAAVSSPRGVVGGVRDEGEGGQYGGHLVTSHSVKW